MQCKCEIFEVEVLLMMQQRLKDAGETWISSAAFLNQTCLLQVKVNIQTLGTLQGRTREEGQPEGGDGQVNNKDSRISGALLEIVFLGRWTKRFREPLTLSHIRHSCWDYISNYPCFLE